ncbi:leukocyte surface antigen CD47 isoform X1 [Camelus dromedarius]|uniref:Leukocyte surface antigen CD47 n=2 Tax=Camelus TaxID=9836 RepID=A0A8B8SX90_CAMFR|nr:leukocyte surface antigen CD47 isoform X1 [Camelus dromedarius]XP_032334449.1 leukocyte surface antigen CD47 isoform X1 [Camelus ferus]
MWPLVVVLLLGSACCGSAQLIFNKIKSVEYTVCNKTVVIPCFVSNIEAKSISELYVKWKLKGENIFIFDGNQNQSSPSKNFTTASISSSDLLMGIASLKMDKHDAVVGNYTCEVTELSREGETIVELKYRIVSWFSPNENILTVVFPVLAILLFWGQFGIVTLQYKSSFTREKTIFLLVAGLMLTITVIVGAILFIPGEYSAKNACGLGLIVIPTAILILLQYCVFIIAIEMSSFTIAILILQGLGYVLSVVGLSLCVSECAPVHGPLLISGLGITALAELLGLVYLKCFASDHRTIQPPRKAVEEPLNAFKESKGMMNDE